LSTLISAKSLSRSAAFVTMSLTFTWFHATYHTGNRVNSRFMGASGRLAKYEGSHLQTLYLVEGFVHDFEGPSPQDVVILEQQCIEVIYYRMRLSRLNTHPHVATARVTLHARVRCQRRRTGLFFHREESGSRPQPIYRAFRNRV